MNPRDTGRLAVGDYVRSVQWGWEGEVVFTNDGEYGQNVDIKILRGVDSESIGKTSVRTLAICFEHAVRPAAEKPIPEYGWELWGQKLAVGDTVRSGHPRSDVTQTGVVTALWERSDGEQMVQVGWGTTVVTYPHQSATLVRVEAISVERENQLPVEWPAFLAAPTRPALMEAPQARARRLAALVELCAGETLDEREHGGWMFTVHGEPYRVTTWRQDAIKGPTDGHALRADRLVIHGPECTGWSWSGDWSVVLDGCRDHAAGLGVPDDRLHAYEFITRNVTDWYDREQGRERWHTAKVERYEGDGRYLVQPWDWGNGNSELIRRADGWQRCERPQPVARAKPETKKRARKPQV
ncbi:hypothetical protein [Saccharothrix sp. ST-888]|uniref:hypothetical protein n=1 Tax=Saccharothrix sp. ST-888 TaxID=1427391 RepID=UPI0012DFEA4B|nr:hypothetical protein [Saccharothrix sp. ST-888]